MLPEHNLYGRILFGFFGNLMVYMLFNNNEYYCYSITKLKMKRNHNGGGLFTTFDDFSSFNQFLTIFNNKF